MDDQKKRTSIQKPPNSQRKNSVMVANKLKDPKKSLEPSPLLGSKKGDFLTPSNVLERITKARREERITKAR